MEEEGEAIEWNVSWISQLKAHWLAEKRLDRPIHSSQAIPLLATRVLVTKDHATMFKGRSGSHSSS